MPLVRLEVRNEYGLGQPELYKETNRDDPKAVLDGVAVAGLVGILRQLGDLAEFGAEVFHGLQEQIMTTASRSHKLKVRVQRIEVALPSLEKAVLTQTSHIHFAYTAGSEWHPRIRNEQNHFIYNDLPRFIMDSYEGCRDPPRLHLLDKFDTGGPGSCLKRYSDPTFFKKVFFTSDEATEKTQANRKARRSKKKRSSQRNGQVLRSTSISNRSSRLQFASPTVNRQTSPLQTTSAVDIMSNSDMGDCSNSFDSRSGLQFTSHIVNGRTSPQTASTVDTTLDPGDHANSYDSRTASGYIECVFHPSHSVQPEQQESPSSRLMQPNDTLDSTFPEEETKAIVDNFPQSLLQEQIASGSCVTWDEKSEIVEPKGHQSDRDEAPETLLSNSDTDTHEGRGVDLRNVDQMDTHEGGGVNLRNVDQMDTHEGSGVNLRNVDQMDTHEGRGVDLRNVDQMDTHEGRGVNLRNVDQMNTLEGSEVNLRNVDQIYTHEGRGVNLRNVDQMDTHEGRGVNLRNDDHVDGLHENSLELMSGMNQIDDIESETDNYMDALNTIESESENDIDCQTKREVELYNSDSDDEGIDVIHELPVNSSDHNPPELESHTASYISSNEGMLSNIPNSDSPESFAHEHIPQMAKISPNLDHSVDNDSSESSDILDDSNSVSVSGPISSASEISDFRDPSRGKIISGFFKSQETPADISGVHSNTFWTNGGLLGLEPSKPPDFTMQNAMKQDSVNRSKDETVCLPAHGFMLRGDEHEAKQDILAKKAGVIEKDPSYVCSTSCQDGVSTKKTDSGFSPVDSDSKCEISVMAPKTVMPVAPDMKSSYAEGNQENDENSSLVFGLSRRLLANGLYKKVSLVHHDNPEPVSSVDAVGLEQCSGQHRVVNQTIPETTIEEQLGHGSPVDSLTSSPPLEHMKISFHPLNGFETSKLKLKFPDGNQRFEGMRDMFPSFQLVPEPDIPLNEFVSESDDDTFCRSSPSKSDDCLSHHSESNSEQWESGEIPEINNLELYDALCRIPSGESMSSSMDFVGTANNGVHIDGGNKSADTRNGVEPSLSGPFLDLPNFDTVNPVLLQKTNDDPNLLKLEYPGQPTPQPPPLPPAQWRMSKPHVDVTEDEEDNLYEALKSAFDLKLLGSAMFQQPKPAPAKQQDTNKEANIVEQKSKQDQQKLNGQKEANQAVNGTEMDERGDFLQQIRSKSFNLRRTVTAKPTNTPAPTNVQVTAILEKANAIRQAVGSDDGDDDDTWSDA
ncbi:protein SCAR1 isoform X46 [Quercus robur]|uniref:protein SCAR1 isoform X46 n=1 Tax=Quercus robur TaxID=38942 RepID=UPI00216194A3|nr:protein SCAR1 isoform X46 [Quercus robur]